MKQPNKQRIQWLACVRKAAVIAGANYSIEVAIQESISLMSRLVDMLSF